MAKEKIEKDEYEDAAETAANGKLGAIAQIVQGIGSIANTVGNNLFLHEKSYFARLYAQGAPQVRDWFSSYKTDYTKMNNQIIIIAFVGIIILFTIKLVKNER